MKVVFFLKISLLFKIICCFFIFVNKHFINMGEYMSKSKRCYNAKPAAYYFYIRTKIPLIFCICISVPLTNRRMVGPNISGEGAFVWDIVKHIV